MIEFIKSLFNKTTMEIVSKAVYVIVLLIAAKIFIYFLKKLIMRIFSTKKVNERKAGALSNLLFNVSRYTVYFFVIYSLLNTMFGTTVQSLLAIAGIGSVAVGFGAQSLVRDFITGFFIMLEDQFTSGDIVTIDGKTGVVENMGLRTTRLRGFDGDVHIIPNGEIKTVTNKSHGFSRASVDVGVSYKEDLSRILKILNDEFEQFSAQEEKIIGKPCVLGVVALGESSVTIRLTVDCEIKEDARIEREMRKRIKDRFDREKVEVPYNQMIVNMNKQ